MGLKMQIKMLQVFITVYKMHDNHLKTILKLIDGKICIIAIGFFLYVVSDGKSLKNV